MTARTFDDGEVRYNRFGTFDVDAKAPVGVAVIGESPYAEGRGDSATLELPSGELKVIERMRESVEQLVVVLVTGRPLVLGPEFDAADAIVVVWLPGTEGAGVADVLTGAAPVMATTPFTWPETVEDAPRSGKDRCDGARYPVGHGLTLDAEPLPGVVPCEAPCAIDPLRPAASTATCTSSRTSRRCRRSS